MLTATQLPRIFLFEDGGREIKLSDPEPSMNPQSVINFYSATYPMLVTATIEPPEIENDEVVYYVRTTLGTKG